MTAIELANQLNLKIVVEGDGAERNVTGIYCCDLLSIVMGRAKADSAWITVMCNINTVAVAVLADVACIILSENMQFDADSKAKAEQQNVCVLQAESPTFELSMQIANLLKS